MRPLRGGRLDDDIFQLPETAVVRKTCARGPGALDDFDRFLEPCLRLLLLDAKALEFAVPITLADAKIEAAAGDQIECRRLLSQQDRMVPWQHHHGAAEAQCGRSHGEAGE